MQPGDLDLVSCDRYEWTSEFGKEYAFVYRSLDTKPGICTTYCSQCTDKVIFTFYDGLCKDNLVALNIEFVAVRDGVGDDGPYKLDAIKVKEYGEKFTVRRRRPVGCDLLFLSYVMGRTTNQLVMRRVAEDYYQIEFHSKSPLVHFNFSVSICCHPLRGLLVLATPPIIGHYEEEKLALVNNNYHKKPPRDVMVDVNDFRSPLMRYYEGSAISRGSNNDNSGASLPSAHNIYYLINNAGNFHGDGNGCINNK